MDLNRATILGRLTRDPESRTTGTGVTVTNFSVATSTVWTDATTKEKKELTEFHNVVAWRKLAEIIAQYLRKGSQVYVEGRIQTRSYEGQDGAKKYRTEIIADNLIMLGGKSGASSSASGGSAVTPAATSTNEVPTIQVEEPAPRPIMGSANSEEISVEDIPF